MQTTASREILLSGVSALTRADTYSVKITPEQHVNLVDSRFISFTIDPSYLFSTGDKYNSKECICMASALTPAYLRIAGPSTGHMTFHNTTISINDVDYDQEEDLEIIAFDDVAKKVPLHPTHKLAVTHREWRKFVYWAKSIGFDLVFALNNQERTASSMWDPNTALNILTVAEKARVGDLFWELGYECTNQSIEEYLNDLETLRVIVETFPPGRTGEWRVVGGDVTKCLQADSKSDFKDYITLSNDMMDALLLNGNSSSQELDRMSEADRQKLVRLLSISNTPLWLTETNQRRYNQLERAADWLASLGYAAKNGFSVHYRELEEEEMYEPTLSFYMALLFKNLVGERVLNVDMEPAQAILFGHCTSLHRKPVAGAVTLFGVNMDAEPARFALKLSKREDGGDIMQFILGHDISGNIIVNGRAMYYEGDIRPVVKHVRPYKTLLLNLPPKSFGFWVLANTKVEACQYVDDADSSWNEGDNVTRGLKVKRSVDDDFEDSTQTANLSYDFEDSDLDKITNNALRSRITEMNKDLNKLHSLFQKNKSRFKRQDDDQSNNKKKLRTQRLRTKMERKMSERDLSPKDFINNILQKAKQNVGVLKNKGLRKVKERLNRNKITKRHSKNPRSRSVKVVPKYLKARTFKKAKKPTSFRKIPKENLTLPTNLQRKINTNNQKKEIQGKISETNTNTHEIPKRTDNEIKLDEKSSIENEIQKDDGITELKSRNRRHIVKETAELSTENDLEINENNKSKIWKILKNIREDLKDISDDGEGKDDGNDSQEGIILDTELSDDIATIKVKDVSKGVIKSTMIKMANVLEDINKSLNRFWDTLSLLN